MGRWVPMAERLGGTVLAAVLSPDFSKDHLAFAATHAGVFRSRDGGKSWAVCSEGLGSFAVQCVAFSPFFQEDRTLYVGAADGSLYRSTDGGSRWTPLARLGRGSAVVDLVAARGTGKKITLLAGTLAEGVFASTDGGQEWAARNKGLDELYVLSLATSPAFDRDRTAFVATIQGLYRTRDGGTSWQAISAIEADEGIQGVKVSPDFATDQTLFVGTEGTGVLRSTDGGTSWHPANSGLPDLCINALALSPNFAEDRVMMAATGRGIALSSDAGESWRPVSTDSEIVLSLSIARDGGAAPPHLVALAGLVREGVVRSEDGGQSWKTANQALTASSLTGLTLSPGFESDATLFAWGAADGVFRSEDGGKSWTPAAAGLEGVTVASLAVSPALATDNSLFAGSSSGILRSADRGATWSPADLRDQEVGLLAISPAFSRDRTLVAATSEGLLLSTGDGTDWKKLGTPAPGEVVTALAIALDNRDRPVLLAATWREATWDQRARLRVWSRTLPDSPWTCQFHTYTVARVAALGVPDSYREDGIFFIGNGSAVYYPVPGAKERTRDGETPLWLPAFVGSPDYPIVSLAVAPDFLKNQTLVAASGEGTYQSTDGGKKWRKLGSTLGGRAPVAVAMPPKYSEGGPLYTLCVGGQLWKWDPADQG